jgi:membrane protein DedA with SNARE-associated domain
VDDTLGFLVRHGYSLLFAWVWLEQVGLPVPGEPVLLGVGALAGTARLRLDLSVVVAVAACLVADLIWYEVGRWRGPQVLRFLCRLSLERDSCVRDSQEMMGRHGARLLLVAKFLPGLNTVAQPLAGVVHMPRGRFLAFDVLGAIVWVGLYTALGYVFADQIEMVAAQAARLGRWLLVVLVAALGAYLLIRWINRQRFIRRLRIARIAPEELKAQLDAGQMVTIVDLRHRLDYESESEVIPGAIHFTPDELAARHGEIPRDRDVVLYCT